MTDVVSSELMDFLKGDTKAITLTRILAREYHHKRTRELLEALAARWVIPGDYEHMPDEILIHRLASEAIMFPEEK